jgi:BolA protein
MTDNQRVERIRAALEAALEPIALDISDDSAAHAGHAGALTGKGHFSVRIVAERFAGLPPLKRHRLVYAALEALLATDIHALSIDARAPQEG